MILDILLFLLGVHFMIMLIAAGFRFIDLWYRIARAWPGIVARLLMILAADAVILALLPQAAAGVFLTGQAVYLVLYVTGFWLLRLGMMVMEKRSREP